MKFVVCLPMYVWLKDKYSKSSVFMVFWHLCCANDINKMRKQRQDVPTRRWGKLNLALGSPAFVLASVREILGEI